MSGIYTYLVAAAASLGGCIVLLIRSRTGELARRGAAACGVATLWSLVLAGQALIQVRAAWVILFVEALRYGFWIAVLRALVDTPTGWLKSAPLLVSGLLAGYALIGWLGEFNGVVALPLGGVLEMGGLVLVCMGLMGTEQAVRTAPPELRSATRLCAIGVGGLFTFDLCLLAQAQLLGAVDTFTWSLRGLVAALLLIPFVMGVRRLPGSAPRVFVSRHVVFYSTGFIAVGLYLCLMALGGYFAREHGGEWGATLQILFLCGAAAVLVRLLLAESPLRRLRVFIATHFYRNKYDYRVEWLRFVQTLSSAEEPDLQRTAVRAVAQIFASPGGMLILRDEATNRYLLRATWPEAYSGGVDPGMLDADCSLTTFLRDSQWVIDLREYRAKPAVYGSLQLPSWLLADDRWRVVAPLLVRSELIGFLVLRSPPEPFDMTFEDRDLLKTVGRNVAVQLAQHEADERLSQSRQFDAYNRFAAFVMHDLKNSVAQLQLVVSNAARHRTNPVFIDDAIGTIENTVERMNRLIEQLQGRQTQGFARVVELRNIVQAAVERSSTRQPAVNFGPCQHQFPVRADPDRLGAVIDHVVRNAQDATPNGNAVNLRLVAEDGSVCLHVVDEGSGMDAQFVRERLFRPFDSTKGSKGMGIGAYQAREYVRSLGGDVEVQSKPGKGTDFCIRLPLCQTTNLAS